MDNTTEFVKFPKIARLSRTIIVTEKIDGTNACIYIDASGNEMLVGSRTRWITPDKDNHGFAKWAFEHKEELLQLGPGRHFGEWWGSGIQRGYGLPKGEKRFSLFNTLRWCEHDETPQPIETGDPRIEKWEQPLPECCYLVPEIYRGPFLMEWVDSSLRLLAQQGSYASHGFMNPEGIVVFHIAANTAFKKTLKNDEMPKSLVS